MIQKIKRRSIEEASRPIYFPTVLEILSQLGFAPKNKVPESKLGDYRDLLRTEAIALYKDFLAWQARETTHSRIDPACVDQAIYPEVKDAFEKRVSHLGKLGRTRVFGYDMIWETVWALLHLDVKPGMKVADVGAENSAVPAYLASKGCEAYALDVFIGGYGTYFREKILNRCKDSTFVLEVDAVSGDKSRVIYKRDDAQYSQMPDNFFDRIVCLSTIEHIWDDSKAMREMARTLKPGGILAITTPFNLEYSQNPHTPEDEAAYNDANHVYSEKELFDRLINPTGLKLGDHDFILTEATWSKHHLPGQTPRFLSVAFFLRKK